MSDINEKSNFVFEFQPVTKLFEEQVRLHPDKCAVASSKESFTYAQLNERANRIANSLIEKGVGCEKIVGVVLERCCDFYAVRQGILKAGGAFAVAAPDYPDDRVQFIFEDAGVPFIITTEEIAKERQELFSRLSCKVLLLEELLENSNAGNPDTRIKEHDLCYCIYTSGSTGKPKGVMIEHINLANFVNPNPKNAETYGYVSRGSVSLSMAAMTFDVSVLEEFLPLTNGMTAVIASDEEILNPIMLGDLIVKNKVPFLPRRQKPLQARRRKHWIIHCFTHWKALCLCRSRNRPLRCMTIFVRSSLPRGCLLTRSLLSMKPTPKSGRRSCSPKSVPVRCVCLWEVPPRWAQAPMCRTALWRCMTWTARGDRETLPSARAVSSARATRIPLFMCTAM